MPPSQRPHCTLLAETLVIIPVVTAMDPSAHREVALIVGTVLKFSWLKSDRGQHSQFLRCLHFVPQNAKIWYCFPLSRDGSQWDREALLDSGNQSCFIKNHHSSIWFFGITSEQKGKIYSVIEKIPLKTSAQHNAEFKLVNTFGGFAKSRPSHMYIQNNEKDNTKYY